MCVSRMLNVCVSGDCGVSHFPVKVYKDYRILTKLRPLNIAPEPLFCSSRAEERVVGTAFIAMSMIEVSSQTEC